MLGIALSHNRALYCLCLVSVFSLVLYLARKETSDVPNVVGQATQRKEDAIIKLQDDYILRWGSDPVPLTKILAHAPGLSQFAADMRSDRWIGWTTFDRLYFRGGTMYIVSDYPELVPDPIHITSKGGRIKEGNVNIVDMEPTKEDLRMVSTKEAHELFGEQAIRIRDVTVSRSNSSPCDLSLVSFWSTKALSS